jgi:uncharacterized membrane protein YgcG
MEYPLSLGGGGNRYNNDDNNNAPHRAAILKKIELYRKVFPQHVVVGWYRVRKHGESGSGQEEDEGIALPTEEDLRLTQEEMGRYCTAATGEYTNGGSPIFVLMDATRTTTVDGGGNVGSKKPPSSASSVSATMEMEEDEELPLTVYETLVSPSTGGNVAFVNADFDLETYEPERIAVEKVFRTRPTKTAVATTSSSSKSSGTEGGDESFALSGGGGGGGGGDGSGGNSRKTGKKSKKDNNVGNQKHPQQQQQLQQRSTKPSAVRVPTELDEQFESLETSIRAMNLRISVLCEYLTRVERGELPFDEALLRSVDGLVRQLPLVLAALESGRLSGTTAGSSVGGSGRTPLLELENEYDNTMLLTYLATVAKTARAVHVYSEKFRTVCDTGKSDRRPLY